MTRGFFSSCQSNNHLSPLLRYTGPSQLSWKKILLIIQKLFVFWSKLIMPFIVKTLCGKQRLSFKHIFSLAENSSSVIAVTSVDVTGVVNDVRSVGSTHSLSTHRYCNFTRSCSMVAQTLINVEKLLFLSIIYGKLLREIVEHGAGSIDTVFESI